MQGNHFAFARFAFSYADDISYTFILEIVDISPRQAQEVAYTQGGVYAHGDEGVIAYLALGAIVVDKGINLSFVTDGLGGGFSVFLAFGS